MIGNGGDTPNGSGGMIPSVAPPFGMTRWVAQTRQNYVSVTPYNHTDRVIRGFQGTHQPAIWMGESGQAIVVPGVGKVKPEFENRGLAFNKEGESATASYYAVSLQTEDGGDIKVEMSASTFDTGSSIATQILTHIIYSLSRRSPSFHLQHYFASVRSP